jgi:hypothetical protein
MDTLRGEKTKGPLHTGRNPAPLKLHYFPVTLFTQQNAALEVLAKRRRSPARSYRSDTHASLPSLHPGPVLPIFPFAPVGITEIVWYVGITIF